MHAGLELRCGLLTARYHVIENEDGELEEVEGVIPNSDPEALAGGQPLAPERRAGMLTTQWYWAAGSKC